MSDMSVRLEQVLERSATSENDGMILCAGCMKRHVLAGYCYPCQCLDKGLDARYESRRTYLNQVQREDMGLALFDALDPQAVPSNVGTVAIVALAMLSVACTLDGAWHLGFGAWHVMKLAISWLLQVSA